MRDALLVGADSTSCRKEGGDLSVEDILDILRLILRGEPLDELLQRIVDTIAFSCNMKRVTLGVIDDRTGMFTPIALHGYPPDQALSIKRHSYSSERMRSELRPEFRIGRNCYYVRAEDQHTAYDDQYDYIMDVDLLDTPRKSPSDWHELDFVDFLMIDRLGNWIGWIEIDEPEDRKVPSNEAIEHIQALTDLAAIAIENSRMCGDAVTALLDAKGYLHLIVHDIGNLVADLTAKLSSVSTEQDSEKAKRQADLALEIAAAIRTVVENVRKFADVRASEPFLLEPYDLREVLSTASDIIRKEHPSRDMVISIDSPPSVSPILADDLIYDLICNLMRNAVRNTPGHKVEISLNLFEGHSVCTVVVSDRGIGIPDLMKSSAFAMFCPKPEGTIETRLMLSTVSLLVERYSGLISVRDRVPGDFCRGACFEVSFPKILKQPQGNSGLERAREQVRPL
jgi:signal transduction histidine kinase